jgi:hypothetical protein
MMTIDLHELINKPGYGSASKIISPPDDGEEKRYVVNVYGSVEISEAVVVTAKTRDEAIKTAKRESSIEVITGTDIIE